MIFSVLFFGTIVRLISINQSLWLDEATTAIASQLSLSDFFTHFMSGDFHPPLYYLVIHYWTLVFGYSEIALRFPSVIFGLLTIYLVYLIAREIKVKWPIIAPLFLATSGLHIYYSQEARMYSMATFLVTLTVYLFLKQKWLLFALTLPLIFLTDYLSILILPALITYSYFYDKRILKNMFFSTTPLLITFIIWFPTFFKQLTHGMLVKENANNWWNILGPVTFKNVALIPTKFMIGRVSIESQTIYLSVIITLGFIFALALSKAKNKLVWSWFLVSLIVGVLISFFIPTLTYFRYLFILPAFYLLLSETAGKILIALIIAINLLTSSFYLLNSKFHREDWRSVAKEIGDQKIVFPNDSQKEALIYYGKEENIISVQELKTISNEPVWLSRYVWEIFDPTDSTRLRLIDRGYNMIEEKRYNGVVIQKYESRN
ncbi:MAG: hypothetical protein UR39_C0001G0146 [Candidatus Woesebacteria bacterium GW2011_GWA1_33_30]|uniref:Glycosyltransferase RgtA/B/C/D-like domain-containing protein n=1 Tax=Candidatus Woesebacteria bacterium GW2011_GWA2_33_28 TaxID=1618561 RepID=A0A0G0AAM2_9BACT|nr:MAG: hypothetical protein UR38_C0001G0147 [Candidatus Woesebacteria bacterium GW2011_GWA2_33_28]KKP49113.1 MAG: hypothetical protein UR39_C0001G0146 [Candidatus Woesebacteria bacterium GW2011_GWA1_33_30]KKP50287.1 MAG: hypothetical protein UR40_C0001G0029 [Microgenomates group bacterium GW2011_GWC1_33_32]KKP52704.1 MAG: hypothetical protein UR44_C0001G0146 [Candidatus Woesebacteria bacterium GW2011_GWB1_33_38]KKP58713.1 MAG: hypothetical protein UR48_C0002G0009 [Microgenomates group bacteriu